MYKEGRAAIRYTKDCFLNPDALVSRDISAAFVSMFGGKKSSILDATSATGIRGIRYYLESRARNVSFLEMNKKAFGSLKKNVSYNKVKSSIFQESVQEFANRDVGKFDFIDLDPFGGITPYVYDLMKISKGGTYLMITATDTAVLCGADHKACIRLYDAKPMHNELCHEVGSRIMVGYVARVAAQFNFGIDVLLCFSYLHYIRAFIQLRHGPQEAFNSLKKLGYAYYCNKCLDRGIYSSFLPRANSCSICRNALELSGRMWTGRLQEKYTIERLLEQMEKGAISGLYDKKSLDFLKVISEEIDAPLYYSIPTLTKKLQVGAVSPVMLIEKLKERGFSVSRTHFDRSAIKTNAAINEIKRFTLGK
jgi:tRNA (guanine26-N2/guanine27-N2)-dimethyltransferase